MNCASCSRTVPAGSGYCPHCGTRVEAASLDPTRTSVPDPGAGSPAAARGLSSSEPSDHGRFVPGTVLGGRYRVVGLLGRGGMGEVYRADDLKLGQAVALKFLPEVVEKDAMRLGRLLNEVKLARQISHPNVCRVYDVAEADGHHFLSMEYVDGEDLASLLPRVGRLPRERALQIARQLCAGLAAAHQQGILHRDLKPANVMIDGRGRARITDFGLATLAGTVRADELNAGTPVYMAPEQRAGKEVTVRSDLYALGLVLYELFTGQRAFDGATPGEIARLQDRTTPTLPSRHVEGFDPAVERVILRCLEREPGDRPSSALSIAAALPGGDPLAAALAAGETPSPELVAAAGAPGGLRPAAALACVAGVAAGVVLVILLSAQTQLSRIVPLPKPPEVLAERAREILRAAGVAPAPGDSASAFDLAQSYADHLFAKLPGPAILQRLAAGPPYAIDFWYRQSPRDLVPYNRIGIVDYSDPPFLVPGMAGVQLDPEGRLTRLDAVPADRDDTRGPWPDPRWAALLEAAGLDPAKLRPVDPSWSPPVYADRRAAWEIVDAAAPEAGGRIEAAAFHGTPVFFRIVRPWTRPLAADPVRADLRSRIIQTVAVVMLFVVLIGAAVLARRNLKVGRSDRRGAATVAILVLATGLVHWILKTHHVASAAEPDILTHGISLAAALAAVSWLFYLAIEPYLRRFWPHALVSWVRLLDGRVRDPLVGRDVLFGLIGGSALMLVQQAWPLASRWWGIVPPPLDIPPYWMEFENLTGFRYAAANLLADMPVAAFLFGAAWVLSLVLLRAILRKPWLAVAGYMVIWTVANAPLDSSSAVALPFSAVFTAGTLALLLRFGLLPALLAFVVNGLLTVYPMTFDLTRWYASNTVLAVIVLAGLTAYGFRVSLGGRSILGDSMSD